MSLRSRASLRGKKADTQDPKPATPLPLPLGLLTWVGTCCGEWKYSPQPEPGWPLGSVPACRRGKKS